MQKYNLNKISFRSYCKIQRYNINENTTIEEMLQMGGVGFKTTTELLKIQYDYKVLNIEIMRNKNKKIISNYI